METLCLESPAKVNLRLEIVRKREDGYHELRSLVQPISLRDTLSISLKKTRGISVETNRRDLRGGKSNLAYRAAQSILEKSSYKGGILIEIEKRIPLGAGLGGGSSNAAVTMKALNQLLELNLSTKELMAMGAKIGADIPFFFVGGAAIASGIGDRLRRVKLPDLHYVLIYPNFEVSTRWAYQRHVLTKKQFHISFEQFLKDPKALSRILWNDLEGVVSKKYPHIGVMKGILDSAGALGTLMTGSGPTVFGIFAEEGAAKDGYRKAKGLVKRKGWLVLKAESISSAAQ